MLAGVILAGGKSTRMGSDKSLLTLPDSQESLLEYCQYKLATVCGAEHVFISGSQHEQGVADVIPNCGPLSGIHGVISQFQSQQTGITELLVTAVDMPDLEAEDLAYLLKKGRANKRLCAFEQSVLPLYIPLSVDVSNYLKAVLQPQDVKSVIGKTSQYSIRRMVDALHGIHIPALNSTQLNNINTPAQWQERCTGQPFSIGKVRQ